MKRKKENEKLLNVRFAARRIQRVQTADSVWLAFWINQWISCFISAATKSSFILFCLTNQKIECKWFDVSRIKLMEQMKCENMNTESGLEDEENKDRQKRSWRFFNSIEWFFVNVQSITKWSCIHRIISCHSKQNRSHFVFVAAEC